MNNYMPVLVALLFFILTPGVFITLPRKGSKLIVAATHAIVFAGVIYLVYKVLWKCRVDGFNSRAARDMALRRNEARAQQIAKENKISIVDARIIVANEIKVKEKEANEKAAIQFEKEKKISMTWMVSRL